MRRLLVPIITGVLPAMVLAATPLETVPFVDLGRYTGVWYDVAHLPHKPQRKCTNTTATYTLRADNRIAVQNRCTVDGREKRGNGKARVVDAGSNARLEVRFFWLFGGDYQVIALDDDYRYAMVGTASRRFLWILSREPLLDEPVRARLLARAASLGFDVERIEYTRHDEPGVE